jgi:hypothetical protein
MSDNTTVATGAGQPTDLQNFELGAAGLYDGLLRTFGVQSDEAAKVYAQQSGTDPAVASSAETQALLDQAGANTAGAVVEHPIDTLAGGIGTIAGAGGELAGESLTHARQGFVGGLSDSLGVPSWLIYVAAVAAGLGAVYFLVPGARQLVSR